MPHSMTGFASAEARAGSFRLVWEIRSVNHRFLELGVRMPEELRAVEQECRALVAGVIKRGKVDCTLRVTAGESPGVPNRAAAGVLDALHSLEEQVRELFPSAQPLTTHEILRWPGVLEERAQGMAELAEPVKHCLAAALAALEDARRREGVRIAEMLERRNTAIDRDEVGAELEVGLPVDARPAALQQHQKYTAHAEPAEQRLPGELAVRSADGARFLHEIEHGEQRRADRQAEQIEQNQHSPREVGGHSAGCGARCEWRTLGRKRFGGGHGG